MQTLFCCSSPECRLRDVVIDVLRTFTSRPANGEAAECARVNAEDVFSTDKTRLVLCTAVVVGRFVMITTQEEKATLALCDVQVFRVEGRANVPITDLVKLLIAINNFS